MSGALLHVRVKRQNQTIFIISEPSDSFGQLRAKLQKLVGLPLTQIRLFGPDKRKPLEDDALLSDHGIKDDAVLYMTLQQGSAWEDIDIDDGTGAAAAGGAGKK